MVVHWDGKILPDLIGKMKVDRIAVLVSYDGTSKFLGAPKIETSTGENIATVVYNKLIQWNLVDKIDAASFDTTASNTGIHKGALKLLEKKLGRDLMNLACRHHIYEIGLKSVFESKFSASTAPTVSVFDRFAKAWDDIDHDSFLSSFEDVGLIISEDELKNITIFCKSQLVKTHSRKDYTELLELVLIFLGVERFKIRTPGATSNARWMAKAIYSLKIFIFREQFELSSDEVDSLRDICFFFWFGYTSNRGMDVQTL